MKRVVIYGCSHAWGSEMAGRGDLGDAGYELNMGKHIADALGLPFHRAAEPGASNRFILHKVIEHAQPGDLCIFAWTYFARDMYIASRDSSEYDVSDHYSQHQVGNVIDEIYKNKTNMAVVVNKLFKKLSINPATIKRMKTQWEELGAVKHTFLNYPNLSHVQAIARYQAEYGWELEPSIVEFLEHYTSANNIAKSRGCRVINLCMDNHHQAQRTLDMGMQGFPTYKIYKENGVVLSSRDGLLSEPLANTRLYKDYISDPTRIPLKDNNGFVTQWRKDRFGDGWGKQWPGDRMGHCGPDAHEHWARLVWDFALKAQIIPESARNNPHFLNTPPKGRGGFD